MIMKQQTFNNLSTSDLSDIDLLNKTLLSILLDYSTIVEILHKHYDFDNVLLNSTSQSFRDILNNLKSLIDQI